MKKTTLSEYFKKRRIASEAEKESENKPSNIEEYPAVEFTPKMKWFEMKPQTDEEKAQEDEQAIQDEKIGEGPELYDRISKDEYQKYLEDQGFDSESAAIQTSHIYDGPETFNDDFKAENLNFKGQLPTRLPVTPWDDRIPKVPVGRDALFKDLVNKYKDKENE